MHRLLYSISGYRTQTLLELSAAAIQKAYRAHRRYERQKVAIAVRFAKSGAKEDAIARRHVAQDLAFWEEQRALIRRHPLPPPHTRRL